MAVPGAESIRDGTASLGEDHLGPAPGIRLEPEVADPHAVPEAGAKRLRDRFLRREAHREEAHGAAAGIEQRPLLGHQQAIREMLPEAAPGRLDALDLHEVRADAEDHAGTPPRAPVMRRFISATAGPKPAMTARATIAWPMFSSTTSGIAATGCTLW